LVDKIKCSIRQKMKSFSKSVAVLATVALAQTGDEFENYNLNLEEIADILGAYDLGEYGNDYGTNYGGAVESSAEDAPITAEELLNVDYNTVETTEVIGEYEEAIDGQERRPLAQFATFEEKINIAKPANNFCKSCSGVSYDTCKDSNVFETCNDAQDVCVVKSRFNSAGEALFSSGCKQRNACLQDEQGNFVGSRFFLNRCKSNKVPNRWLAGSECTFCSLMSPDGVSNILADSVNIVASTATVTSTVTVAKTQLLENPEDYMLASAGNYILGGQSYV
jgi:hypothetical protein